MQFRIIVTHFLCCVLSLTSCVNYYGVPKNQVTALNAPRLNMPHTYQPPKPLPVAATNAGWWLHFNDPQLNQLIQVALADSPNMHAAESRLRAAQQLIAATEALVWPSIDGSGYRQRQRFSAQGLIPPPFNGLTFNIGEIGLNFNYEFDFWGKNRQLLAASISEARAAEADIAAARLVIAAAVATAYFQLQNDLAKLEVAKANVQQQRALLHITQARTQRKIVSDIELQTATASLQSTKLSVIQLEQATDLTQHQLALLLGKNPSNTKFVVRAPQQPSLVNIPSILPANLLAQRPDIIAARARTEAAAHRINVAKAQFFPNINLNGLFSYQGIDLSRLFKHSNQNNAATVAFDLPIFDAGARRAHLGLRYAEYDTAVSTYNQTILTALQHVADQLSTIRALNAQLDTQQQSLNAIAHNYKLTNMRYQSGIVDYEQVLNIQGLLLQQQAQHIQLHTLKQQAVVALITALGGCMNSKDKT